MEKRQKRKDGMRTAARYSGMAIEMFGLLVILVFLGRKVDVWMGNQKKIATAILVILGLAGYLYRLYLQLSNKKDS